MSAKILRHLIKQLEDLVVSQLASKKSVKTPIDLLIKADFMFLFYSMFYFVLLTMFLFTSLISLI